MSLERERIQSYVETFAQKWSDTPRQTPESEIQRRNYLLGVILLAEQERHDGQVMADDESVAFSGLRIIMQDEPRWRVRGRLLFASIQSQPRVPMPSQLELLQSLKDSDGKFRHDLEVSIP